MIIGRDNFAREFVIYENVFYVWSEFTHESLFYDQGYISNWYLHLGNGNRIQPQEKYRTEYVPEVILDIKNCVIWKSAKGII